MNKLNELPIETLAPLIKNKEVSPVDLVRATFDQIDQYEGILNAYIDTYIKDALLASKNAEKEIMSGKYIGPLHGIPIGIKDNIYIKDKITTMGSDIHRYFKPNFNATVIKKLYNAGTIITGKLNMHEYALGITNDNPHYGACRNPWDISKISGGSSGGSSVAVSAHMATASLGTDTGGSIRIPSAACGVVGLKPTYGRVSKYGCFPEAWTLDHIGPITKTVEDAALLLKTLEGFDENDFSSIKISDKSNNNNLKKISDFVIGIDESFYFHEIDQQIEYIIKSIIKKLEKMGAKIEFISIPSLEYLEHALNVTDMSEASTVHRHNLKTKIQDFGNDIRPLLEQGTAPSAVDYLQAQQIRHQLKLEYKDVFNKVDVIIAPTMPIMVPKIGEETALLNGKNVDLFDHALRLTSPSNFTGNPSLTVPVGVVDKMPVGLQIIGDAFHENCILQIGKIIEEMNLMENKTPNFKKIKQ